MSCSRDTGAQGEDLSTMESGQNWCYHHPVKDPTKVVEIDPLPNNMVFKGYHQPGNDSSSLSGVAFDSSSDLEPPIRSKGGHVLKYQPASSLPEAKEVIRSAKPEPMFDEAKLEARLNEISAR